VEQEQYLRETRCGTLHCRSKACGGHFSGVCVVGHSKPHQVIIFENREIEEGIYDGEKAKAFVCASSDARSGPY
jgi:hypothetical protein